MSISSVSSVAASAYTASAPQQSGIEAGGQNSDAAAADSSNPGSAAPTVPAYNALASASQSIIRGSLFDATV